MEQTKQQIERFLKKIAQKFPTTEACRNSVETLWLSTMKGKK